jgi:hypothetical protein
MARVLKSPWRIALEAAATEDDVVRVARDYVATLAREQVGLLPQNCRPGPIESCADVTEWAMRLVQECLNYHAEGASLDLMREVSEFFSEATARMSELKPPK